MAAAIHCFAIRYRKFGKVLDARVLSVMMRAIARGARHRVDRVDDQVQNDLFKPMRSPNPYSGAGSAQSNWLTRPSVQWPGKPRRETLPFPRQVVEVDIFRLEGGLLSRLRIRRITSLARRSSGRMSSTISLSSSRSGSATSGWLVRFRHSRATEPNGWLISCAIEAVSSPAVEKRLIWASSAMRCRACTSASWRRRCSPSKNPDEPGLQKNNRTHEDDLP